MASDPKRYQDLKKRCEKFLKEEAPVALNLRGLQQLSMRIRFAGSMRETLLVCHSGGQHRTEGDNEQWARLNERCSAFSGELMREFYDLPGLRLVSLDAMFCGKRYVRQLLADVGVTLSVSYAPASRPWPTESPSTANPDASAPCTSTAAPGSTRRRTPPMPDEKKQCPALWRGRAGMRCDLEPHGDAGLHWIRNGWIAWSTRLHPLTGDLCVSDTRTHELFAALEHEKIGVMSPGAFCVGKLVVPSEVTSPRQGPNVIDCQFRFQHAGDYHAAPGHVWAK